MANKMPDEVVCMFKPAKAKAGERLWVQGQPG